MLRPLHYVIKVVDRSNAIAILRDQLGMKVLRHEEFSDGCKATCNGPYDGRWSKTMIGYGSEAHHFVLEVVYNYGVESYDTGNQLDCLHLALATKEPSGIEFPVRLDGRYTFVHYPKPSSTPHISRLVLNVGNVDRSVERFWAGFLGMKCSAQSDTNAVLACEGNDSWLLELKASDVVRGTDSGRTAFAISKADLEKMQNKAETMGVRILTPLVKLDTPGKASVQVVILADDDGHEVCLVEEEGFSQLSTLDPNADSELDHAIQNDHSKEVRWKRKH